MFKILVILILFTPFYGQSQEKESVNEIPALILKAKNEKSDLLLSKEYLDKAYGLLSNVKPDSLKIAYHVQIAVRHFKNNNDLEFRKINEEARVLSQKIGDTLQFAETYWDLGVFYQARSISDSAYYAFNIARKNYSIKNDVFFEGRMLLNMAITQSSMKDFTGSEITTAEALDLLKPLKANRQIYGCYNNLAIITNGLGEFEKALVYHNEALNYLDGLNDENYLRANTLNNIGVVLEKQEKYSEAIEKFQFALTINETLVKNVEQRAMIIDNLWYNIFKNSNSTESIGGLFMAHNLRDSINDYSGLSGSKLHLADYYLSKNDTAKSILFLKEVKLLSKKSKINKDLQEALLKLSELDIQNSSKHYAELVKLTDSLNFAERKIRNKANLIKFEFEEQRAINAQLEAKNRRQLWIAGVALLLTSLLFIIRNQRIRFKNLQLEREQQASNEEIYEIMLQQQEQIEVSKNDEKRRISEELHDGVLGKLFGTRLLLDTLNDSSDPESVLQREKHIQELQEIEEEVRNVSHELHEKSQAINISYVQLIEKLLKEKALQGNFTYDLKIDKKINWTDIDNTLKMNLYRILQESLQNITKYAKANTVTVILELIAERLMVEVKDDGVGFIPEKKAKGIGHKNIASRIKKMQGVFQIESAPSKGTKVHLEIPV